MALEMTIASAASIITVIFYVVAIWTGGHRTISALAGTANLTVCLAVIATSLALALGLSANLLVNPNSWLHAVGKLVQLL